MSNEYDNRTYIEDEDKNKYFFDVNTDTTKNSSSEVADSPIDARRGATLQDKRVINMKTVGISGKFSSRCTNNSSFRVEDNRIGIIVDYFEDALAKQKIYTVCRKGSYYQNMMLNKVAFKLGDSCSTLDVSLSFVEVLIIGKNTENSEEVATNLLKGNKIIISKSNESNPNGESATDIIENIVNTNDAYYWIRKEYKVSPDTEMTYEGKQLNYWTDNPYGIPDGVDVIYERLNIRAPQVNLTWSEDTEELYFYLKDTNCEGFWEFNDNVTYNVVALLSDAEGKRVLSAEGLGCKVTFNKYKQELTVPATHLGSSYKVSLTRKAESWEIKQAVKNSKYATVIISDPTMTDNVIKIGWKCNVKSQPNKIYNKWVRGSVYGWGDLKSRLTTTDVANRDMTWWIYKQGFDKTLTFTKE